jgi:Domain of unknown function (DUF4157)
MSSFETEHAAEKRRDQSAPEPSPELSSQERLASAVGNQAFSALARQGAGILPGGRAHPDVEAAISQSRGGGQSLDDTSRQNMGGKLGDSLDDVRVHTDDSANALASSVSARAFTTGNDIYFAKGEHNPGSSDGQQLLAHELTHVVQQRGASTSGPLTVSQPGDALENEAEATAGDVVG